MLVVRVSSGMGNQLFQYAFALYLKERYGETVYLDKSSYKYRLPDRNCFIDIVSELPECNDWKIYNRYPSVFHYLSKALFAINPFTRCIRDSHPLFPPSNKFLYFDGYWQTDRYVSQLKNPIHSLTPKESMPDSIREYLDLFSNNHSISLHVRRGDFFSKAYQPTYGVCDAIYYEKAIKQLTEPLESYTLFVFSDDPDWVKTHVNLPASACFIKNEAINPFWYIYLMAHCHDNILSNSSFSWWGAYLNQHADKKVIVPRKWTLTSDKTIALDSWIKR